MSTPTFTAAFTISGTTFDDLKSFLFFIILIDPLVLSLSIDEGTKATVSA